MSLLSWLRQTIQTKRWLREQADAWASRYFPEAQRPVAARLALVLVEQLGVGFDALTPTTRLTEDLRMDELEPTQVVLALEEEFSFSIPDEDCAQLSTVADLIRFLHERVGQAPA